MRTPSHQPLHQVFFRFFFFHWFEANSLKRLGRFGSETSKKDRGGRSGPLRAPAMAVEPSFFVRCWILMSKNWGGWLGVVGVDRSPKNKNGETTPPEN